MRWTWVLLDGMEENGRPLRDGDPESPRAERNSVVLSLCADDLGNGGIEQCDSWLIASLGRMEMINSNVFAPELHTPPASGSRRSCSVMRASVYKECQ
jgi:hypothetical protein